MINQQADYAYATNMYSTNGWAAISFFWMARQALGFGQSAFALGPLGGAVANIMGKKL